MNWLILIVAGLFEIGWAVGLKYTRGFTQPGPTLLVVVALVVSVGLLGLAARTLPIGTAYAVWTGIGAIGPAILGMVLFDESRDWARLLCITLIIVGVLGLKATYKPA